MVDGRMRPKLHLRLSGHDDRDGEITLSDLARLADQTQRVISRLAQSMTGNRGPGRMPPSVAEATTMYLVGLKSGSTVLEIAGPEPLDTLSAGEMPPDLGDQALLALVESLEVLSEPEPTLPVGVDDQSAADLDVWLRSLRRYTRVSVSVDLGERTARANLQPRSARTNLRNANIQPSVPFISASHQALTGRLYALNLRTGTFSIEDDSGRSIRLIVPEDVRDEAAQLVNSRVRAIGNASLDSHSRLMTFSVAALEQLPNDLFEQDEFFSRHDLVVPPLALAPDDLRNGVIPDLSEDEIEGFMSSLELE